MTELTASEGTGATLETMARVPSDSKAALVPMSSSPGWTSERPASQAESTIHSGGRVIRSRS